MTGCAAPRHDGQDDPTRTATAVLLAKARKSLGWSLRDAARVSGVPNAHISQIETGAITQPGFPLLVKLAKAYGIPLRRLTDDGRCPACGKPL